MINLSVVLATRNEEKNLKRCLQSVADIADEIIVVDEYSTDGTQGVAKNFGARVYLEPHHANFHITKQLAIDKAKGKWILQLDADEVVTSELAREIKSVIKMTDEEILARRPSDPIKEALFKRHMQVLKKRDGEIGEHTGKVAAFFIPRLNIFLGKPLIHAGVYPDPAIRLIKKGMAWLPAESVHEIMHVDGEVAWLFSNMEHYDSPTLERYFDRLNRYTTLQAGELKKNNVALNPLVFLQYTFVKPLTIFIKLYLLRRGYLDGLRGFVWAILSALHFPISYFKYWEGNRK